MRKAAVDVERTLKPRLGAEDAEPRPGNLGSTLEFTAGLWFLHLVRDHSLHTLIFTPPHTGGIFLKLLIETSQHSYRYNR
ncbi:hypothetical protein CapIbe_009649 [Capra ibex]